jgi:hypothetical protein
VPAVAARIGRGVVDELEQRRDHHARIADVHIIGSLRKELSCVAGKAKRAIDGHDGADQVRPLGGETGGDLPTHRMSYDDEFLTGVLGRDQPLDVGDVIGRRIGAGRRDLGPAMPPQVDSNDTVLALEHRQLPTPIVGIASQPCRSITFLPVPISVINSFAVDPVAAEARLCPWVIATAAAPAPASTPRREKLC